MIYIRANYIQIDVNCFDIEIIKVLYHILQYMQKIDYTVLIYYAYLIIKTTRVMKKSIKLIKDAQLENSRTSLRKVSQDIDTHRI